VAVPQRLETARFVEDEKRRQRRGIAARVVPREATRRRTGRPEVDIDGPREGRRHYSPTFTDRDGKRRATVGWDLVHVAIDDATRLAYAEVLADEKATTAIACRALGVRHLRTRPYRLQTNGKAERPIRTLLGGRAYGAVYGSSREHAAALDGRLWTHNHRRRHAAIGRQPPITRLNNLLGTYI
jgi:transposase InsO family protein